MTVKRTATPRPSLSKGTAKPSKSGAFVGKHTAEKSTLDPKFAKAAIESKKKFGALFKRLAKT